MPTFDQRFFVYRILLKGAIQDCWMPFSHYAHAFSCDSIMYSTKEWGSHPYAELSLPHLLAQIKYSHTQKYIDETLVIALKSVDIEKKKIQNM